VDREALLDRIQGNLRKARQAQSRAEQLIHDARNVRQRIAARRFLKELRRESAANSRQR
jgi:hypothetical protein